MRRQVRSASSGGTALPGRADAPVRPLLRELAPEPARFWVRFAPRRWPAPEGPWLNLADGTLAGAGGPGAEEVLTSLLERPLDDLLYLPPVPSALAPARDRLAARHAARGTPVLVQLLPGDAAPEVEEPVTVVRDLTPFALAGSWPPAAAVPGPAAAAAWPLLPGGPPAPEAAGLAELVAAGVEALQAVAVELEPRRLRELGAELPEERYLALFHGAVPDPGAFARAAAEEGLAPLMRRPLPRPPLRGASNLRLAGLLGAVGELRLRLGGAEPAAQALLRAARFAERAPADLEALAREGNLGVLPWLEGEARRIVEQAAGDATGERRLLLAVAAPAR